MNDETIGTGKGWSINDSSYDFLVIPRNGGAFGQAWGIVALGHRSAAEKAFRLVSSNPTSVVVIDLKNPGRQQVREYEKTEEVRTVIRERI